MSHTLEQIQEKRRGAATNLRLSAHYLEIHNDQLAIHHAELACIDIKAIKLDMMEAASSVSGIGEE